MIAQDAFHVAVDGVQVRIRVSGPETAEPVLLIHGIGRSLEDWQDSHDRLAAEYRVISTDLPGFGFTRRMKQRAGLPSFARAVIGVLDALGERRPVHMMGNSLGGAVAMTAATTYPGRVASLVLANSAGFGKEANVSLLPMLYGALSTAPVIGSRFRPLARQAGIQVNRDLFYDKSFATEDMIRHAGKVGRQPDFRATFLSTATSLGMPMVGTYAGWRRRLLTKVAESKIPTLVVWGDTDNILPAKHFDAAVASLPHAKSHLFANTGHMPQIERAEEFTKLAADFVRSA